MDNETAQAHIYNYLMDNVNLRSPELVSEASKPVFTLAEIEKFTEDLAELVAPLTERNKDK